MCVSGDNNKKKNPKLVYFFLQFCNCTQRKKKKRTGRGGGSFHAGVGLEPTTSNLWDSRSFPTELTSNFIPFHHHANVNMWNVRIFFSPSPIFIHSIPIFSFFSKEARLVFFASNPCGEADSPLYFPEAIRLGVDIWLHKICRRTTQ